MKLNHNYFPRIIIEWNKLDPSIYDSSSYPLFKKMVVFLIFKAQSVRLQDGLSQLPEQKLSQKQLYSLNPICVICKDIKITI